MADKALTKRLEALETGRVGHLRELPAVVPDSTPEPELERMRLAGRQVYRESDPALFDLFV